MKVARNVLAAALALAAAPVTVLAQTAVPVVGAVVFGPQGNEVGKVDSVTDAVVVVDTGKNKAALPASSFGSSPKGAVIGFTREQLDAAIEEAAQKAAAALDAALVAGATVRSQDGIEVGSIKEVNAEGNVVVDRAAGPIAMPKANFATDDKGPIIRMTAAQLEAAIAKPAG